MCYHTEMNIMVETVKACPQIIEQVKICDHTKTWDKNQPKLRKVLFPAFLQLKNKRIHSNAAQAKKREDQKNKKASGM